jgi:dihydroneopterin aldolase
MDIIGIDDLVVEGVHGYYEHEWRAPQSFRVQMDVLLDTSSAGTTDALASTIDYDSLKEIVKTIFAGERRALIETLAEDIAEQVLDDARVHEVRITIRKTDAWENGVPRISIVRTRKG